MYPEPGDKRVVDAERPLRLLLAASILLPLIALATASWISYREHMDNAVDRLERTLGHVYEHATKVFETFDLAGRYVEALIGGTPNEALSVAESFYHQRLKSLTDSLPQLRDIWLIDQTGHPMVSGTIFPMRRDVDLSDRPFFQVHRNDATASPFLSEVINSRAVDRKLFLISRRRVLRGSDDFFGVTTIAVAPEYFTRYYARLPGAQEDVVGLLRQDGAILAFYPRAPNGRTRLAPGSPLLAAIGQNSQGLVTGTSPADGVARITVFRRLPQHGVYVMVGIPVATVIHEWLSALSYHLIFGLPATLALVLLSWIALQRTRRESSAHAELRREAARREVTEQALRQAQKMEAIGRLTGGIAHDFNNLLTAIIGNVDLASTRLKGGNEHVARFLSAAKEASHRAAALVQRLLAFSRQHPHEPELLDVGRLIVDMSDLFRRSIGETIALETALATDLWTISVDRNQLENAILNLALNARDAMPEGGHLKIGTANVQIGSESPEGDGERIAPGDYVVLSISDTGTGMSKEVREQAFEPFFTTKPKGIGTGLGLSMVYGFVKQSGGYIRIHSELGRGTTVGLYLPRAAGDPLARRGAPAGKSSEPMLRSTGGETILLVEDDAAVNRFSSEGLRELGYNVLSAATGSEALALLAESPDVKLLFTDVVLPGGMNGRRLADAITKGDPEIKVLFATGYTRDAIVHQGRIEPGLDVLMKPYTYDALARKVREVLDRPAVVQSSFHADA